jgi:hypothetical protein
LKNFAEEGDFTKEGKLTLDSKFAKRPQRATVPREAIMLKMAITPRKATPPQRVMRLLRGTLMRTESLHREGNSECNAGKDTSTTLAGPPKPCHRDMMPGRRQSHGHIQDKGNNAMHANVS